ncbi:mitochondrial basic amino acids transporter isoform X2 [Nilaparvata lugens]|uniref:mitochondrial basic amino acids transporter isoform X2 n=1 Tax=Nilaparvata lugens TaxID=108931 RepID=UPI000B985D71|nr:mitochondrial basic amino acids transporter isoform X2 [Nilaparvata lugens]
MSDHTFRWYDFGAGWFAGVCGLIVGHPLDTIKVRQQAHCKGSCDIFASILRRDGVLGFYKGMFMPLVSAGVMNSVYFGCYGNSLRALAHYRGEHPKRHCCDVVEGEGGKLSTTYRYYHWDVFLSGCVAGLVTTVGLCPVELSKIQLQTQTELSQQKGYKNIALSLRQRGVVVPRWTLEQEVIGKVSQADHSRRPVIYSGTWDFLLKTFKAGGVRNLFVGLVPMLVRDPLASGLYMLLYVRVLECFPEKSMLGILIAGANAGIWSWAVVVPVDVVKSRIQADNAQSPKYKGMWDCVKKSYKEDGARVFVRGFWVTVLRAMPVNAAVFFGYEMFIDFYLKYVSRTKE